MGFLSGIGKFVGGLVKTGLGIATGGISNAVLGIAGSLISHKSPGGKSAQLQTLKAQSGKVTGLLRLVPNSTPYDSGGKLGSGIFGKGLQVTTKSGVVGGRGLFSSTADVLRMSPVLPGGSVATPMGNIPQSAIGPVPPSAYGGTVKRKKRKKAKKSAAKRKSSSRKSTKRKSKLPKFGSPAWRKKFHLGTAKKRKKAA